MHELLVYERERKTDERTTRLLVAEADRYRVVVEIGEHSGKTTVIDSAVEVKGYDSLGDMCWAKTTAPASLSNAKDNILAALLLDDLRRQDAGA